MPASRNDWKTKPAEGPVKSLDLKGMYLTPEQYERVIQGHIPDAMEDKWFIWFENGTLYCHRSWTGDHVYSVEIIPTRDGGYEAAACLTPASGTLEEADRAAVGVLLYFLAGDPKRMKIQLMRYEALAGGIGDTEANAAILYSVFGLPILETADSVSWDLALWHDPQEEDMDYLGAVHGGILGVCIGDALGVPVEFQSAERLEADPVTGMRAYGTYHQPAGTWSDDSSMTLALAASLGEKETVDPADIMARFLRWYKKGEYSPGGTCFDIGRTTARALTRAASGVEPELCGSTGPDSNGNGSLMRILPMAYILQAKYGGDVANAEALSLVHTVSGLTHRHPIAKSACGIYVSIAARLIELRWRQGVQTRMMQLGRYQLPYLRTYEEKQLLNRAISEGIRSALAWYRSQSEFAGAVKAWAALEDLAKLRARRRRDIPSGGYVVDTLCAALWCLLNTDNYRDCVLLAVNLGNDTDTTAAVAGGLAGLAYGRRDHAGDDSSIPREWILELAGQEIVYDCINKLTSVSYKILNCD